MLSKPEHGWSNFHLDGTSVYDLSYLDDIAFEWIEQAIHGLETMMPFTVKGYLEPDRFLCTVSYWNCHIICEDDERMPLDEEEIINEVSHTSMLQFCEYLYDDIKQYADEWAAFAAYQREDTEISKKKLEEKLSCLKRLISENREHFGKDYCFL